MPHKIRKTCKILSEKPHKTCKSTLKVVFYALFENPRLLEKTALFANNLLEKTAHIC